MTEKKKITLDVGRNLRKMVGDITGTVCGLGALYIEAQSSSAQGLFGVFHGWIEVLDRMHQRDRSLAMPPRCGETFADYTARRIRGEMEAASISAQAVWTENGWSGGQACPGACPGERA